MQPIASLTSANTSFSKLLPGLQLVIDSHSLGTFKTCPRLYFYEIICGLQPRGLSVHLFFGLALHKAAETFHQARATGASHDEALEDALAATLAASYDAARKRPWVSESAEKNRFTLIRTVVWYLDHWRDDPLQTLTLADGSAAVELHFLFDLQAETQDGERRQAAGWLDRLASSSTGGLFIPDIKTTKQSLSRSWFDSFTPGTQFSMYALAGKVAFETEVEGIIIDGIQVLATLSRHGRELAPRPPQVLEEWRHGLSYWLTEMEIAARKASALEEAGHPVEEAWPQNDKSCDRWGGCAFRGICSRAPAAREQWLATDFTRRVWDPLVARTDI